MIVVTMAFLMMMTMTTMINKTIFIPLSIFMLAGCIPPSVNKIPLPTGGSREEGKVVMSYTRKNYEMAIVDWNKTGVDAAIRCIEWGYTGAVTASAKIYDCYEKGETACNIFWIKKRYRCTQ